MASVFTMNFEFRHQLHTALVTDGSGGDGRCKYTVMLHNDPIKDVLPDSRLSFNNLNELKQLAETEPKLQELVLSLAAALQDRLAGRPKSRLFSY